MTRINPKSDSYEALLWDVVTNAHRYIPKSGDRVLDLGANRGMFSLYCAARGCHVMAFEPNPELLDDLCWASEVAKEIGLGSIEVIPAGVWSSHSSVAIFKRSDSTAAATMLMGKSEQAITISPCMTLREALDGKFYQCVKVDVEGAEAEVFSVAEDADFQRIGFLTIEIHNDLLPKHVRTMLQGKLKAHFPYWKEIPVKVNGVPTDDVCTLLCWR